jgi:CO/xanthine dehydrogenase FAD-binding subunit
MNRFSYARARDVAAALQEIDPINGSQFIAGGTNLIDLM